MVDDPTLQDAYASPSEFSRLFDQFAARQTAEKLVEYRACRSDFEVGGKYFEEGKEAARAAIVLPVALFFSLLGTIGRFSKRLYLIATGMLAGAFLGTWGILSVLDNNVTRSDLFRQMLDWNRQAADDSTRWKAILANITHVVAVGQGYSHPRQRSDPHQCFAGT